MYSLRLECIGDNGYKAIRDIADVDLSPWVAQITGYDPTYFYRRHFIRGNKDYSEGNSIGSRGVYLYFSLGDGIYEVKEHKSWGRTIRYFLRVHEGQATEITTGEVGMWLNRNRNLQSTSTPQQSNV